MVKNILITGGLGYVGGRLAVHLNQLPNHQVTVTSRKKIKSPFDGVQIINPDYQKEDYNTYLDGIDTVVHLAALNEIDCVRFPYQAIDVNVSQTLKWLKAAENSGVKQFIYFSTVHVYGSPLTGTIDESRLPRPTHPYSITHKAAEDYVLASRDKSDLNALVLRLSNSFGAPTLPDVNRWTLLVNDLCKQVVQTGVLKLRSSGTQLRDFITLTDVCRAVEHLLKLNNEKTRDGLFNLSGESTLSIFEMTQRIANRAQAVLDIEPEIQRPAPAITETAGQLFCSSQKLQQTGFHLSRQIEQELDDMLRFCQHHFATSHD